MYMGEHKEENELLIKYGLPTDLWFHVDDLSSAHVYLRINKGYDINTIPEGIVQDCAALCKANSISGSKRAKVRIVYTMWSNLRKSNSMEVGQIGYRDNSKLKYLSIEKDNAIINRLKKTQVTKPSDVIQVIRQSYDKRQRKLEKIRKKKEAKLRTYDDWGDVGNMVTNYEQFQTAEEFEDG